MRLVSIHVLAQDLQHVFLHVAAVDDVVASKKENRDQRLRLNKRS
jgi:hypothetical protein